MDFVTQTTIKRFNYSVISKRCIAAKKVTFSAAFFARKFVVNSSHFSFLTQKTSFMTRDETVMLRYTCRKLDLLGFVWLGCAYNWYRKIQFSATALSKVNFFMPTLISVMWVFFYLLQKVFSQLVVKIERNETHENNPFSQLIS